MSMAWVLRRGIWQLGVQGKGVRSVVCRVEKRISDVVGQRGKQLGVSGGLGFRVQDVGLGFGGPDVEVSCSACNMLLS